MSLALLVRGGEVLDPVTGRRTRLDVRLRDGVVAELAADLQPGDDDVLDATGCVVTPGLVDLRAHLGEPGREDAEDVDTASAAAAAGGYTAVCSTPDTDPVCDTAAVADLVWRRGRDVGLVDVLPTATLTRGRRGEELTEFGELRRSAAAVDFFSDGDRSIDDALLMRRALQYSGAFDVVVANHPQDAALSEGAQMHEGRVSSRLGLPGAPAEAEAIIVARDLELATAVGARVHFHRITTKQAVDLVRAAKAAGVRVTADCTPHHLVLTDEAVAGYDPTVKVIPPLRSAGHVAALREAVADGTIDAIATDHAPVTVEEKEQEWEHAPAGTLGLETALAVLLTDLVAPGHLDIATLLARLTTGPARVRDTGAHGQPLAEGVAANLAVIDLAQRWTVDPYGLRSRSRNTAFAGRELSGRVRHTVLHGRPTLRDGDVVGARLLASSIASTPGGRP